MHLSRQQKCSKHLSPCHSLGRPWWSLAWASHGYCDFLESEPVDCSSLSFLLWSVFQNRSFNIFFSPKTNQHCKILFHHECLPLLGQTHFSHSFYVSFLMLLLECQAHRPGGMYSMAGFPTLLYCCHTVFHWICIQFCGACRLLRDSLEESGWPADLSKLSKLPVHSAAHRAKNILILSALIMVPLSGPGTCGHEQMECVSVLQGCILGFYIVSGLEAELSSMESHTCVCFSCCGKNSCSHWWYGSGAFMGTLCHLLLGLSRLASIDTEAAQASWTPGRAPELLASWLITHSPNAPDLWSFGHCLLHRGSWWSPLPALCSLLARKNKYTYRQEPGVWAENSVAMGWALCLKASLHHHGPKGLNFCFLIILTF